MILPYFTVYMIYGVSIIPFLDQVDQTNQKFKKILPFFCKNLYVKTFVYIDCCNYMMFANMHIFF